jgi:hypothetical protein
MPIRIYWKRWRGEDREEDHREEDQEEDRGEGQEEDRGEDHEENRGEDREENWEEDWVEDREEGDRKEEDREEEDRKKDQNLVKVETISNLEEAKAFFSKLAKKSSPDEWDRKGIDYFEQRQYEQVNYF